jgi:ABC-type transporter Mla subunit MlaD
VNLESKQAEIPDLKKSLDDVAGSLDNAESCETLSDFNDNIDDALAHLHSLVQSLKALKKGQDA